MSTAAPAVSVVMTVYDGEQHLAEAVDSILGQSFADFEFVVVDDGSSDRTPEILRGYDDARLRVLSPGRLGRAGALNYALCAEQRSGRDELLCPDRLERLQLEFAPADWATKSLDQPKLHAPLTARS